MYSASVSVALVIQHAMRHIVICGCSALRHFFPHYLTNGTIFGKQLLKIKCVFWFCLQLLSETFLILRRNKRDIAINVHMASCKVSVILVRFSWDLNFLDRLSKNSQIQNFMIIRPVGAELFHADRRTDMTTPIVAFRNFANGSRRFGITRIYASVLMALWRTAVAQWLRCCATNRKVAGSIPAGVIGIFHWHKIHPIALWPWGSTQPLTEMSTRSISWG